MGSEACYNRYVVNSDFSTSLNRWKAVTAHGLAHSAPRITESEKVKKEDVDCFQSLQGQAEGL